MNIGYGELKSIESYEFIKAVVEGRQPSTSFAEGYRVERVCDAVKRSAETRTLGNGERLMEVPV